MATLKGVILYAEMGINVEIVATNDYGAVASLLTESDLPVPQTAEQQVQFLIAIHGQTIIGCIGWETYGKRVLLRSLAVQKDFRGRDLGTKLVQAALSQLASEGIRELFLLTNNAADFATRFGFQRIDRCSLPADLIASSQFGDSCCSFAQCMQLLLDE